MMDEICCDCGRELTNDEMNAGTGLCFWCEEISEDIDREERDAIEAEEELGNEIRR